MRLIAVAASFGLGALVTAVVFAHAPQRLVIDLAQPLPVATWWGRYGFLCFGILCATLALAYGSYTASFRRRPPALVATLAASGLALAVLFFWRPLFSSDVYAYAAYGEMAARHIDPYVRTRLPMTDPLFRNATWQWSGSLPICVYGEAFVMLARAIVTGTASLGARAQLDAFRVLASVAFLATAALLAFCGRPEDGERGRRATLVLALNPVALWCAAEGHNDTLMLLAIVAGAAIVRTRPALGAFLATSAALVKAPALAAGATLAGLSAMRSRSFTAILGFVIGAVVVAIAAIPLVLGVTRDLAPHAHYLPLASVQSLHPAVAIGLAALLGLHFRRLSTTVDRLLLATLILWLAIPNPYPWYGLWLLPLAAWATDRRLVLTAILVTAAAVFRYLPDTVAIPAEPEALLLGAVALLGYTPLLARAIISGP